MTWLQSLDLSILRLVRDTLRNPLFDWLMPILSGNALFAPGLILAAALLAWKGGVRGRLCLFMLVLVVLAGDNFICNPLKNLIGRARPTAPRGIAVIRVEWRTAIRLFAGAVIRGLGFEIA